MAATNQTRSLHTMNAVNVRGQVTIPKHIRAALGLVPSSRMVFDLNDHSQVILRRAPEHGRSDRFDAARGKADVRWRTDELMALLRHDE